MAEQQPDTAINLGTNLNVNALMGSLLDLQQLLRAVPQIVAKAQALEAENADLKAKLAAVEASAAAA